MLRSIAVPARALSVMCFVALTLSCSTQRAIAPRAQPQRFRGPFTWTKLQTEPYRGKQDDIFFVTPQLGFYVNGSGRIYKTNDGGTTWVKKLDRPGTYFRCIAFVDDRRGFAGNIGTDYFPGVTDTTPLYETRDGGETWTAVTTIVGSPVKGLCAIDIVKEPFINAGKLDHRIHIHAAGRVGGPSVLVTLRTPDGFVGYAIGTEVYKVNHPDHAPTSVSAAP